MKIERFITEPSDSFDRYVELKPDPDGTLCLSSDVAKLEAEHAELLEAATNALWWWDGGNKISPKASDVIGRLRAAISKAKGETL